MTKRKHLHNKRLKKQGFFALQKNKLKRDFIIILSYSSVFCDRGSVPGARV